MSPPIETDLTFLTAIAVQTEIEELILALRGNTPSKSTSITRSTRPSPSASWPAKYSMSD